MAVAMVLSSSASCGGTIDCLKKAYEDAAPSVPMASVLGAVGMSADAGGSPSVTALKDAKKEVTKIKDSDGRYGERINELAKSKKAEALPIYKSTAALIKCKTLKSIHADMIGLSIRSTLVYSEAKTLSLSGKLKSITQQSIKESEKDVFKNKN